MSVQQSPGALSADDAHVLATESVALVRRWLAESAEIPPEPAAAQLAALLRDPAGLPFTVGFVDGVVRPEDPRVAAKRLAELAREVPAFLPWHLRAGVRLAAVGAGIAPALVVPLVRRALRGLVRHLVIDASPARLGRAIDRLRTPGTRLNVNLLGEAVLGEREAARRLQRTTDLLERADVDYVSVKVSAVVGPHSPWAFDSAAAQITERLRPLYERAAAASPPKFINLDMEEYRDLDLTIEVFTRLLDSPGLEGLEAGIVLQTYLPDALPAMHRLQEWAAARRARGGAPIKVRVVKGANLPMERVESQLRGWPLATWLSKRDTDAHYKRVLDLALRPEHTGNVRVGVAGHNLFDLAFAWLLAGKRGVREAVDVEMLLGMAPAQAEVVRREVGALLLYTPVVHPAEFDVAIAYLVRRLEEGASQENFMSAVFDLDTDPGLFDRERERFVASVEAMSDDVPSRHRTQDRAVPTTSGADDGALPATAHAAAVPAGSPDPDSLDRALPAEPPTARPLARGALASAHTVDTSRVDIPFANAPDTDPATPENRAWAAALLSRVPGSRLGVDLVEAHTVADAAALDAELLAATTAAPGWAALGGEGRARILERAADVLESRRGRLCEVMAAEAGKTLDEADPEVSEAVDFARYYAQLARGLDDVPGARFVPARLTVVTPPWNFPVAIPAGSTLAALAAGSAVVVKPAREAARCGSVMVEALWDAGVPREVLRLVHLSERGLGQRLLADPRVDRVILTGAYETAELFRSFRADLPLLAETSGKNAIVVTPSADLDLAVRDVVHSAFGHAGQKCSAASLVILVGSVARSDRFRRQLLDAVTSLEVGPPSDPTSQVGPVIAPPSGKLLEGLTKLDDGERWAVEPRCLDGGALWSPGVRVGVRRGSTTHLVEYFGPVLGVMAAATLAEAVELQNEVDYGLTAGLHSFDPEEIAYWLDRVQAGNLYVNRGTTGAIVRRQPFGGWKKSAVGPGFKAGGPNYLVGLGSWEPAPRDPVDEPLAGGVAALLEAATGPLGHEDLDLPPVTDVASTAPARGLAREDAAAARTTLAAAALAWRTELALAVDVSGLEAERNVLRYRPVPVHVRVGQAGTLAELVAVVGAGLTAGGTFDVSVGIEVPDGVARVLDALGVPWTRADDEAWLEWLGSPSSGGSNGDADAARTAGVLPARVRLLGADGGAVARALGGRPDVAVFDQPVTRSGRLELLPFLREQSVSVTAHRFGTPNHLTDALL